MSSVVGDIERESFNELVELRRQHGPKKQEISSSDRLDELKRHFNEISFRDMMAFAKAISVGLSDKVSEFELACALRDWAEAG